MKSSPLLYAKGLTAKQQRAKRRRERKERDREFQKAGETHRCVACRGYFEQTAEHHRDGKSTEEKRYNRKRCWRLCKDCHTSGPNAVENIGEERFLEIFPHLRDEL